MSDDRPTVRVACRRRMTLDGADAEALEYALTLTERELADALKLLAGQVSEVARLREQVANLGVENGLLRVHWADEQARIGILQDQLDQERATSARLRGLLGEVEWIDASWLAGECPICVRQRVLGHAPDCRLVAALKEKP